METPELFLFGHPAGPDDVVDREPFLLTLTGGSETDTAWCWPARGALESRRWRKRLFGGSAARACTAHAWIFSTLRP